MVHRDCGLGAQARGGKEGFQEIGPDSARHDAEKLAMWARDSGGLIVLKEMSSRESAIGSIRMSHGLSLCAPFYLLAHPHTTYLAQLAINSGLSWVRPRRTTSRARQGAAHGIDFAFALNNVQLDWMWCEHVHRPRPSNALRCDPKSVVTRVGFASRLPR
jgi:hypothetical protein